MATITLNGVDYDVYQTVAEIDEYAAAAIGETGDAWRAAAEDDKKRAGVTSTRTIDRQQWQGEKTDPDQVHAFPRTGLTYADGTEVDSTTVPQQVLDANSELAMALVSGATVQTDATTENATRRLKAGSVEIEYFRMTAANAARFPLSVMELIGLWLGGLAGVVGSESTGVDDCTSFDRQYGLTRGF